MVSLAALRSTTESRLEYSFPSRGSESDFRKAFSLWSGELQMRLKRTFNLPSNLVLPRPPSHRQRESPQPFQFDLNDLRTDFESTTTLELDNSFQTCTWRVCSFSSFSAADVALILPPLAIQPSLASQPISFRFFLHYCSSLLELFLLSCSETLTVFPNPHQPSYRRC